MKNKKTTRKIRKGACFALLFYGAFCLVSCAPDEVSTPPAEGYSLWGVENTAQILRDVDVQEYAPVQKSAEIVIDTAKNEYEGSQVVISAKGEVEEYTIELSDLTLVGGDAVYSKENISVSKMMYAHITNPWNDCGQVGWYPDGLLPYEKAVEYKENTVKAGENQSLYFTFFTPATQETGIYEGAYTITINGEKNTVPVRVNVRNVTVNETTHSKSIFRTDFFVHLGEYNSTQALRDAYTEFLIDYRVCPWKLVVDTSHKEEDAVYYAEKAYELCGQEKCSTISLPVQKTSEGIPDSAKIDWDGNAENGAEKTVGQLTMYVKAMVDKSFETGCDLLSKCYVYGIDEPIQNRAFDKLKEFHKAFTTQRLESYNLLSGDKARYLEKYPEITEEFFEQVMQSIQGIRCVTTTKYLEEYEPYVDVWCPLFNDLEAGLTQGVYDNEDKLWGYGALSPTYPYTSYHVDNTLLSQRILGWLQSIYNVEGNLYWAAEYYARFVDGKGEFLDEYYEDPYHYGRYPGEGFLLYPGKKYGIDGPLSTVRMEAIRDGYEEYELMYNIKEQYAKVSEEIGVEFSAEKALDSIASSIHAGMSVTATNATFATARKGLLDLSEFSRSGACFVDYTDDGEGKVEYKLFTPDGVTVDVSGLTKGNALAVTGGTITTYSADMNSDNTSSVATFTTKIDGKNVSVNYNLPGQVTKFDAVAVYEWLDNGVNAEETAVVDAQAVNGETGKLIKLSIPQASEMSSARMEFSATDLTQAIHAKTDKVAFNFYYTGTETTLPVNVYVKFKKRTYEEAISSSEYMFTNGANSIVWSNLTSLNWERNGAIEYIAFEIGEKGAPKNTDLYIKSFVVYKAREATE